MRIWILAIATVAVLIGVAGGSYWYGGKGTDESALVLNRAPAASDGIKVHGDWTVTVSNPDGSVDSVHEFKNDLTHRGRSFLTALLGGRSTGFDYKGNTKSHAIKRWNVKKSIEAASDELGDYFDCKERIEHYQMAGENFEFWEATVTRESSPGNPLIMSENCTLVWVKDNITSFDDIVLPEYPGTKTGKLYKVETWLHGTYYNFLDDLGIVQRFKYFSPATNKNHEVDAENLQFTVHNLSGDDQIDVTEGQLLNLQVRFSFE